MIATKRRQQKFVFFLFFILGNLFIFWRQEMVFSQSLEQYDLKSLTGELTAQHPGKSGLYVLDKGEESLLARA